MIPRGYPAIPLRVKLALAPWLILALCAYWIGESWGLLEPPAPRRSPAQLAREAKRLDVPRGYLAAYRQAAPRHCPGLHWSVLAAVGRVESNHGRARLPGVRSGWNHAGAAGPMQFGIGKGKAGNSWAFFGRDFDRDGRRSVYDPGDAIPAAARYLCAHGAPRQLRAALHAYNPSWAYVRKVQAIARRYQAGRPAP
jgi:hypothetical protein